MRLRWPSAVAAAAEWDNLGRVVNWRAAFIWITVAAVVGAFFSQVFDWEWVRNGILIAWVVLVLLVMMTRGMRWTSALIFASGLALLGAMVSQLEGSSAGRSWFLLAWAVSLLPVAISLFSHPMRSPAWGVFVGFWGVVGALWLIVIQILAVTGLVSGGQAYALPAAWPLGLLGIWFLVASILGFGGEGFPRLVDLLGVLAGAGLLAISISTWTYASADVTREAGLYAAVTYILWAIGLGWVFWGTQHVTHRFRGRATERAVV
jgi:hypothetical protein